MTVEIYKRFWTEVERVAYFDVKGDDYDITGGPWQLDADDDGEWIYDQPLGPVNGTPAEATIIGHRLDDSGDIAAVLFEQLESPLPVGNEGPLWMYHEHCTMAGHWCTDEEMIESRSDDIFEVPAETTADVAGDLLGLENTPHNTMFIMRQINTLTEWLEHMHGHQVYVRAAESVPTASPEPATSPEPEPTASPEPAPSPDAEEVE